MHACFSLLTYVGYLVCEGSYLSPSTGAKLKPRELSPPSFNFIPLW